LRHPLALGATAAIVLLAGGCGSSGKTTTAASPAASTAAQATTPASTTPASTTASSVAAGGVLVSTKHDKLGSILAAGPKKLTVYLFEADKGSTSSCSGACAQVWPPVTTAGGARAGGSASSADLGSITRADGTKQVTYKGHPLYYYAKDKDSGDAYGQGSKSFGAPWYVLSPSGSKVDKS
jgi:predicted lipoprotein with Yx(FWY)xxD motif